MKGDVYDIQFCAVCVKLDTEQKNRTENWYNKTAKMQTHKQDYFAMSVNYLKRIKTVYRK